MWTYHKTVVWLFTSVRSATKQFPFPKTAKTVASFVNIPTRSAPHRMCRNVVLMNI